MNAARRSRRGLVAVAVVILLAAGCSSHHQTSTGCPSDYPYPLVPTSAVQGLAIVCGADSSPQPYERVWLKDTSSVIYLTLTTSGYASVEVVPGGWGTAILQSSLVPDWQKSAYEEAYSVVYREISARISGGVTQLTGDMEGCATAVETTWVQDFSPGYSMQQAFDAAFNVTAGCHSLYSDLTEDTAVGASGVSGFISDVTSDLEGDVVDALKSDLVDDAGEAIGTLFEAG
jgi:hypothetical protein